MLGRERCIRLWRICRLLWPWNLLAKYVAPIPPGLYICNFLMQRILRVNGSVRWMVHFTSYVTGQVTIGANVWKSFACSGHCYIQGGNGIIIGDEVIFAPGVKIISANHNIHNLDSWDKERPVVIGRRCWIGANAVILPGVELGDECIVGAGAVVTRSYGKGTILVGVPARPIPASPG